MILQTLKLSLRQLLNDLDAGNTNISEKDQEEIDAFTKLKLESEFQRLSPGGAISYVETPNLENNIPAVLEIIEFIQKITDKELSRVESANYIGVSVSTFDNYRKKGLLPEGHKRQGMARVWYKSDLDKYLNEK